MLDSIKAESLKEPTQPWVAVEIWGEWASRWKSCLSLCHSKSINQSERCGKEKIGRWQKEKQKKRSVHRREEAGERERGEEEGRQAGAPDRVLLLACTMQKSTCIDYDFFPVSCLYHLLR